MESNLQQAAERPIFLAELVPYRSLGRKGFKVMLALAGGVCCFYGLFFLSTGAWPIGFFFGLDFLLLYLAFRANYRAAKAREEVEVSRTALSIRKFAPSGKMVEHRFNPFWARFHVRRHQEYGILSMQVAGQGRSTSVGAFLNPDDRESFATAFRGALATATQRI